MAQGPAGAALRRRGAGQSGNLCARVPINVDRPPLSGFIVQALEAGFLVGVAPVGDGDGMNCQSLGHRIEGVAAMELEQGGGAAKTASR